MRIPTASYNQPSRSPQRLINCFAQQSVGKTPVEVVGTPGISPVTSLQGEGRGLAVMGGSLYAVAGNTLYDAISGSEKGEIPGSGRLIFADNGSSLVTDTGYAFNGSTVSAISDVDKVPWSAVGYCDGRIVFVETGTGRFGATGLYDLTIDGLDFATA